MRPKNLLVSTALLAGLAFAPAHAASAAPAPASPASTGTQLTAAVQSVEIYRPKKKQRQYKQRQYNRGYRAGYRQGVKDGYRTCKKKNNFRSFSGTDAYTRGWLNGYDRGFAKFCRHR